MNYNSEKLQKSTDIFTFKGILVHETFFELLIWLIIVQAIYVFKKTSDQAKILRNSSPI